MDRPLILSVVIPTYRRWDRLQLTLAALEAQSMPKKDFEVIVSDDGSGDGTVERLNAYAAKTKLNMVAVTGPNGGPATARNRGIAKARGEWVAMTDDDCVPERDWLVKHVEFIREHPEYGAFGGQVVRYKDTVISRYVDWTGSMLPPLGENGGRQYLVTANALFRRDLLVQLGGFDETYRWPGGEDPDLSFRAIALGTLLGYNPGSVVRHMHRETVRGTDRMFWHHGLGFGTLLVQQGKPLGPSWRRVMDKQKKEGVSKAFRERSFWEALAFAFLERRRHDAFYKGMQAAETFGSGAATSAN